MPHTITKKYKYQPLLYIDPLTYKEKSIYRPVVPIRLSYNHKVGKALVECLIDSGADINLFPADWGESVGINIKKGIKHIINGIGNIGVEGYKHEVTIYLGSEISFKTHASFSYHQQIPLLGRNDFFTYFESVSFFENDRTIELEFSNKKNFSS